MLRQDLEKIKIPDCPGVYFFLDKEKKVLYIGRATSLRDRIRSYFNEHSLNSRSSWIQKMVSESRNIRFIKTKSVLEAILIESKLIKEIKPRFNTELKDDKSFNYIVITDEEFPQILITREQRRSLHSFGPFPSPSLLKEIIHIARRIFPWRDNKCNPGVLSRNNSFHYSSILQKTAISKPCFSRQVGLCPGVCTNEISKEKYKKEIKHLALFLSGNIGRVEKKLEKDMLGAIKRQDYESASEIKKKLFAIKHINDIALIKDYREQNYNSKYFRIEAYDLSHFGGKEIVGAMSVVENSEKRIGEYRLFKILGKRTVDETFGFKEMLSRRFSHKEWKFPDLIVVDGNEVQLNAVLTVLNKIEQKIPVVAVIKDKKHNPVRIIGNKININLYKKDILLANSEAHRFALKFQRKRRYN